MLRRYSNSFIALALRMSCQNLLLRAETQSLADPVHVYFAATVVPNVLCAILHLLFQASRPGEATRGYMHGGLFLDFVGQAGPSSMFQLLAQDATILILQLVSMDVTRGRNVLSKRLSRNLRSSRTSEASQGFPRTPTMQDMDAEERGTAQQEESQQDLPDSASFTTHIQETLYSGRADLGTFGMFKLMKEMQEETTFSRLQGPSSVLSSIVGVNIRRRRYDLKLPKQ